MPLAMPRVAGTVYAVAPDGSGGWYVGGSFTHVGGTPRSNLAHVFADQSLFAQFMEKAETLPPPQINSMWVWIWQDQDQVTKGFRFMGQRFTLDAYVFGQVMWRKVGTVEQPRDLPKSLDLLAAMGSDEAYRLLVEMGEKNIILQGVEEGAFGCLDVGQKGRIEVQTAAECADIADFFRTEGCFLDHEGDRTPASHGGNVVSGILYALLGEHVSEGGKHFQCMTRRIIHPARETQNAAWGQFPPGIAEALFREEIVLLNRVEPGCAAECIDRRQDNQVIGQRIRQEPCPGIGSYHGQCGMLQKAVHLAGELFGKQRKKDRIRLDSRDPFHTLADGLYDMHSR
jgi:hypothetical protein